MWGIVEEVMGMLSRAARRTSLEERMRSEKQEDEKRTYDEESCARMSIRMSETVCSPSETSEGSSDPQSLERAMTA
jgi:hypothetical protein